MRTLVEQTRDECLRWLDRLNHLAGEVYYRGNDSSQPVESYSLRLKDDPHQEKIGVHVLMGGANADDWDIHPERDAILIGTQDMLLNAGPLANRLAELKRLFHRRPTTTGFGQPMQQDE